MPEIKQEVIDKQMSLLRDINWCKCELHKLRASPRCQRIEFNMERVLDVVINDRDVIEELTDYLERYLDRRERILTEKYLESMKELG